MIAAGVLVHSLSRVCLLAGVSWFEVDRSDVLRAKSKALKQAGAAFSEEENQKGNHFHPESSHDLTSPQRELRLL